MPSRPAVPSSPTDARRWRGDRGGGHGFGAQRPRCCGRFIASRRSFSRPVSGAVMSGGLCPQHLSDGLATHDEEPIGRAANLVALRCQQIESETA
jgi:hypothetical protein